jgi:hypothetical protein
MLKSPLNRPVCSHDAGGKTLSSEDGLIEFTLVATPQGLYVERGTLKPGAARVMMSTLFRDESSFTRWCEADSTRFDYPLVYVNLKREGEALLARER